ncbi:MAG: MgtC/SapB family protein [Sulfuricurvum sp.]|uniref:MgtC/SapB family protein n=1 Tax=Sulfuricurvum sp. TaxID=2025608 RepID=UPI002624A2E1|nr:MgtC/SapB family protein [Sulfuricurvum sp.]MDD2828784.1 MgtC/SapB family protein [Sulfuricurvum sp.]MDD4948757.1 MgtC/SapB family protein [Sulfuricurvum sp.]
MDPLFIQNSALSLVLGFLIGLQREMHTIYSHKNQDFGGARTFSMIALFGFLSSWLTPFYPYFFLIASLLLGLLLIAAYIVNSISVSEKGSTTEFAALVTFIIGAMLNIVPPIFPVFIAIVVLSILNLKETIQVYQQTITKQDLGAAILFLVMTFVILPILPDKAIDPMGLFNLYRIWLMVVLVAGISFFGYITIRLLGSTHGIGVAGLFGGLVSSTAVAMSMARRVHENGFLTKNFAIGISLASSLMLIRIGIEIWVINPDLIHPLILPIIMGSVFGYGYIGYLYLTSKRENIPQNIELKNPFDLKEALLMGLLFGATLALIALANRYLGGSGVYAVAAVSGVADVDAIILSLSSLAKNGLSPSIAHYAILIAVLSNSIAKMGLVFFLGNIQLFRFVSIYYLVSISAFTVTLLLTLRIS